MNGAPCPSCGTPAAFFIRAGLDFVCAPCAKLPAPARLVSAALLDLPTHPDESATTLGDAGLLSAGEHGRPFGCPVSLYLAGKLRSAGLNTASLSIGVGVTDTTIGEGLDVLARVPHPPAVAAFILAFDRHRYDPPPRPPAQPRPAARRRFRVWRRS